MSETGYEFDQWGQWYGPLDVAQLEAPARNARRGDMEVLEDSMRELGFFGAVLVRAEDHVVVAGNHRLEQARREGRDQVPCMVMDRNQLEARKIALVDNRSNDRATYDTEVLLAELGDLDDFAGTGYGEDDVADLLAELEASYPEGYDGPGADLGTGGDGYGPGNTQPGNGALAARFGAPPYSILDSRKGYWQDRKNQWLSLGIRSEVGRDKVLKGLAPAGNITSDTLSSLAAGSAGGGTTSVFDPMLCELVYRWWLPTVPGARILDPFAGGSVRGVVAGWLGAEYTGLELRPEQVLANRDQVRALWAGEVPDYTPDLTPVEQVDAYHVKRDDLYSMGGQMGGKVRSCAAILGKAAATGAPGVVTAGSRHSPQVAIVAALGKLLGLPVRVHVPAGEDTPELAQAAADGATVERHRPGHNSVIVARAREDAEASGWLEVPFGMECSEAVEQTAAQVDAEQLDGVERIVVPVGSGMSLAGILHGLQRLGLDLPVLGVVVGADPEKRLDQWAPDGWRDLCELVQSELPYEDHAPDTHLGYVPLDPVYEGKCVPYLEDADLLWCVGRRVQVDATPNAALGPAAGPEPVWITGDSAQLLADGEGPDQVDLVFTCPPYADLEVYSDDPADLSAMDYPRFVELLGDILGKACARLAPDRFCVVVMGEARDKVGAYYGLVPDTVKVMQAHGMHYHGEAILITPGGTLPVRAGRAFNAGRKLGKSHQNVLVFYNGDPRKVGATFGEVIPVDEVDEMAAAAELGPVGTPATVPVPEDGEGLRVKVSAGWAGKQLDCTVAGITRDGGCGGACCTTPSYWPPSANPDTTTTACHYLGDTGCTLTEQDRPVKCLLYPLVPNKKGTLVQHYRGANGCCKPCVGTGPTIAEALQSNLAALAGAEQAQALVDSVAAGEDAWLDLPPSVAYALAREDEWERDNVVPVPRTQYVPADLDTAGQ